jgi:hypothetical protein
MRSHFQRTFCLLSVLLASSLSATAVAQTLTPQALFNRCYAQIVGKPIPRGHALFAKVKAGTMSAMDACNSLVDKTALNPANGLLLQDDAETRSILNRFYGFHRSWFPGNAVEQIQGYGIEMGNGTGDLYDTTEPGLALTRAAFMNAAKYSEVLTLGTGVHGLRQEDPAVKAYVGWTVTSPMRRLYGNAPGLDQNLFNFRGYAGNYDTNSDLSSSLFMNLPKIEVGELVGVRATTETAVIPNVIMQPLGDPERRGNLQPGMNFSFDVFKTLGGGVLGSPSYIMLNYGHEFGLPSNGTTKVARRWAQATMNTFLCASLPALRESDVTQFVVGNSSAPFRNGSSCVMCHANLDQMAYTTRNVVLAATDFGTFTLGSRIQSKTAIVQTTYRPEIASVGGWPSEPVTDFHRQVPSGRLYFRSFSGALVNQPVNNIPELGAAIANTDDYYQCAAKRYFSFLTGIQVALYDRQDPRNVALNKSLSEASMADRVFVEKLATELRQTQSVKQMIKSILSSDYFKSANFRP